MKFTVEIVGKLEASDEMCPKCGSHGHRYSILVADSAKMFPSVQTKQKRFGEFSQKISEVTGRMGKEDGPSSTEGVGQRRNRMPKFKKGDKVRVRLDSSSTFRGRMGVVDRGPITHPGTRDCFYMVRFGDQYFLPTKQFAEEDLEAAAN